MTYRACITCYEACGLSWIFSILHVVVLEELWTFVLGTKQSVRITSVQFISCGSLFLFTKANARWVIHGFK